GRVEVVPLHPQERDVAALEHEFDERLPEVAVRDRLLLRVQPAPTPPALPPPIAEAVDDVGRVRHDLDRTTRRSYRLERRGDLHALVRRARVGATRPCTVGSDPGPSTGARVPAAGTVGVGDEGHRSEHGTGAPTPRQSGPRTPNRLGRVRVPACTPPLTEDPQVIIDGFVQQLPDIDPTETEEWLASLDAVVGARG